jgi:hypothetical protein
MTVGPSGKAMTPAERHEIYSVCEVLTLAGLRPNPFPMLNRSQEERWQRRTRREILGFICKHYGKRAAQEAARLKLFTLH